MIVGTSLDKQSEITALAKLPRLSSSSWLSALYRANKKARAVTVTALRRLSAQPPGDPGRGFAATGGHRINPRLVANI
jgi:hypothetical protein